jgi:hypothetical protein
MTPSYHFWGAGYMLTKGTYDNFWREVETVGIFANRLSRKKS